jgi:hypothetical protein
VFPTAPKPTLLSSTTLTQGNANGRENIAHQVTGYMDVKNAKVNRKTGSEHQLRPSSFKPVTSGAISKNASNAQIPNHIVEVAKRTAKEPAQLASQYLELSRLHALHLIQEMLITISLAIAFGETLTTKIA